MSAKMKQSGSVTLFELLKTILLSARSLLFAFMYPKFVKQFYDEKVTSFKREVYADIDSIVPSDKSDGRIKILEIGVGPGSNLEFFPKKCRLIALDKNQYFENILVQNLQKHPGIILDKFVNECAEHMASIPSNSIDVVVSSSIHCSVDNSQSVLKEIRRVLVPGGRYYFFEHVLDEPHTMRYKWQMFVNKTGLWTLTWQGCVFADFEPKISKFGLLKYKGMRYTIPNQSWFNYYMVYLIASHYGGYAVKET